MQSVHWEGFVTHILRNPFTRKDDRYSEKKIDKFMYFIGVE